MKKKQVDSILVEQAKRRFKIFIYVITTALIILITFLLILRFVELNKTIEVSYNEQSDTKYKVHLRDNVFFEEDYLNEENKYIANLIDYVDTTFNYKINVNEKNVDYNYSYKVDAIVTIKESSDGKPLYAKTTNLIKEVDRLGHSKDIVHILENLKIDYNNYNDLAKRFVNVYGLDNVISTLTINMYVNVVGNCEEFKNESNNQSVISIEMPLNKKTVEITTRDSISEVPNKILLCDRNNKKEKITSIFNILAFVVLLGLNIYDLVKYLRSTRTAESIYEKNLKKILNSYHSYIQKVDNELDLNNLDKKDKAYTNCNYFKVDSFTDLLEIRDSLNAPILMFSNKENTRTQFVILNIENKAIYVYEIKVDKKND